MKKFLAMLLALVMVMSLVACSKDDGSKNDDKQNDQQQEQDNSSNNGKEDGKKDDNSSTPSGGWTMQTSKENPIYTVGEVDGSKYAQPVLVTSFGQSTDAAMLETVMKKAGVAEYTYNATATKDDVAGYKTVIIAVGASTKGLGAAGISESAEKTRAEEFMAALGDDVQVIMCHLGGINRRGDLSDELADMVMAKASFLVVKEDGNDDGYFTDFASKNNLPISLIFTAKDSITVFTDLFAAK